MSARSIGRRKLTVGNELYYWYIHDELVLRIYSEDKKYIVHYDLFGEKPLLVVHGEKFNAVSEMKRPLWVEPPAIDVPFGPLQVKELILWSMGKQENLIVNLGVPDGPIQRLLSEIDL